MKVNTKKTNGINISKLSHCDRGLELTGLVQSLVMRVCVLSPRNCS